MGYGNKPNKCLTQFGMPNLCGAKRVLFMALLRYGCPSTNFAGFDISYTLGMLLLLCWRNQSICTVYFRLSSDLTMYGSTVHQLSLLPFFYFFAFFCFCEEFIS
jgi:hypothetical protein